MTDSGIRQPNFTDLDTMVNIHISSFNNFFLSFLGPNFLHELYSGILADPYGIAYIFEHNEHIGGFVAGSDQTQGLYRRLLARRWWRFGIASLPAVIKKPSIVPRLIRAINRPNEATPVEKCGTLMSVAVDPRCQGQKIGKELVWAFLVEAKKRGLEYVNLTTDAVDNDGVNYFYQKLGFHIHRSFVTPEGRKMNEYLFNLGDLN